MPSFGRLHSVVLVKTDVSEERFASVIRVTKICKLITLAVTSNRNTLQRNGKHVRTSVLTGATRRHIPEDGITHSHSRENF
jgi:hypothetical protein